MSALEAFFFLAFLGLGAAGSGARAFFLLGFFGFFGKVAALLGPLIYSVMTVWFDSRVGIFAISLLIVAGALMLRQVGVEDGMPRLPREAAQLSPDDRSPRRPNFGRELVHLDCAAVVHHLRETSRRGGDAAFLTRATGSCPRPMAPPNPSHGRPEPPDQPRCDRAHRNAAPAMSG